MTRNVDGNRQPHDRQTRRRVVALGAATLGGSLLAACSVGGGQPPADQAASANKTPVTAAIAAGGWVSEVDKELHRKVWKAFEQSRPHVTLDINEIAFSTDKLLTAVAGGTPPDAAYIHPNNLPSVAAPGAYQNLDNYAKRDKSVDLKAIFPKVLEFFKFKGVLYQLPYHSGPSMIYYNKSLFKQHGVKLPEEYDKAGQWQWHTGYTEAVRLLTQDRGGKQSYGWDGRTGIAFVCVPMWCNGGGVLNATATESLLHLPKSTEALQSYADIWNKLNAVPTPAGWTNFTQGHIGMVFGFRGMGPLYRTIQDFELGIWHNPGGPAGKFTRSGPSGYGVVTGAKNSDEGWEFCKFYTGPVAQGILFTGGFNVPMTTRKEDMEAFRKDLAPWEREEVYMEAQDKRLRPLAPLPVKWADINTAFNREWALIRDGKKSAQQAMTEIRPEIEAALKGG
ncbi:MAG: extracellular solute-binding protein [Chloroflexi bacterium]|nr:extracellular solute-binding protein [Chloroflexota bacterium]